MSAAAAAAAAAAVASSSDGEYRLRALVSHHGDHCWSGHYTCVARIGETDRWVSYDDRCVSALEEDPTLTAQCQRGGYLLLYETTNPEKRAAATRGAAAGESAAALGDSALAAGSSNAMVTVD